MNLIHVVGMDPSLSNWGICKALVDIDTLAIHKIENLALLSTEPEKDKITKKLVRKNSEDLERARILYGGMMLHCMGQAIAIAEVPVGSQSARAMASYGVCIGVLSACPIPLIQVTPNEVKIAATGDKQAVKEEMILWATERFPDAPWLTQNRGGKKSYIGKNEHLADATAAIEAGIQTQQFAQAAAMMRAMKAAA